MGMECHTLGHILGHIRKPANELTPADLEQFSVWEWASDEEGEEDQDETTVRPVLSDKPVRADKSYIIKANFTLADGTVFVGVFTSAKHMPETVGWLHPIIFTEQGQVLFYYGVMKPTPQEVLQNYQRLGKTAVEVFPIKFHAAIGVEDGISQGIVESFLYLTEPGDLVEAVQ